MVRTTVKTQIMATLTARTISLIFTTNMINYNVQLHDRLVLHLVCKQTKITYFRKRMLSIYKIFQRAGIFSQMLIEMFRAKIHTVIKTNTFETDCIQDKHNNTVVCTCVQNNASFLDRFVRCRCFQRQFVRSARFIG